MNQKVMLGFLRDLASRVTVAGNGREAVEAIGREGYDLVLMDIQMPVMDGLSATRAIRAMAPPVGTTPVIAVTAGASEQERRACLEAGFDDMLEKPVMRDALAATILAWTTKPRPADAAKPGGANGQRVPPGFDAMIFVGVLDVCGPDDTADILAGFMESMAGARDRVRAGTATGDLAGTERAAHELKGVAGNLGAKALFSAAGDLIAACRAGDTGALPARVADFEAACTGTEAAISQWLDGSGR